MIDKIHIFHPGIGSILGPLNSGLDGVHGTISIHASKNGLRMSQNGKTLAKGKTLGQLHKNLKAEIAKAEAGKR